MVQEGGLRAPERKSLEIDNDRFWNSEDLDKELRNVILAIPDNVEKYKGKLDSMGMYDTVKGQVDKTTNILDNKVQAIVKYILNEFKSIMKK